MDAELNHLYDDTKDLGLSSNEDLSRSPLGSTGVPQGSSAPLPEESGGDHTYVNLQQQEQPPAFSMSLEDLNENEKKFFEEDEDAGYDTVGLHLIGAKKSPGSARPLPSPNDPAEDPPFPNHGYSRVNMNRVPKNTAPATRDGYSTVALHSSVNGIVREVNPEPDMPVDGSTAVGVVEGVAKAEESQLSHMLESLETRFKTLQESNQSAEITKVHSMLEKLTAKLETVDTQLNTLSAPAKSTDAKKLAEQEEDVGNGRPEEDCNRDYLKTLDEHQVAKLMEYMSLGQYCEKILSEHISGEILLECDDAILQEEIGVTSRIHRIRIMKLISGQHSAKPMLEKD